MTYYKYLDTGENVKNPTAPTSLKHKLIWLCVGMCLSGFLYSCVFRQPSQAVRPKGLRLGPNTTPRFDSEHQQSYYEQFDTIKGTCHKAMPYMFRALSNEQHRQEIYGAVGELGVFYGKCFAGLAHTTVTGEKIFAVDSFEGEKQGNHHGDPRRGDHNAFMTWMDRFGLSVKEFILFYENSMRVSGDVLGRRMGPIRMAYIDGGHTQSVSYHDLRDVIAPNVMEGGIVIVNDFLSEQWIGVTESVVKFLVEEKDFPLKPFLIFNGSIYFTTPSHHWVYLNWALEDPAIGAYVTKEDDSQYTLARPIGPQTFDAAEAWKKLI